MRKKFTSLVCLNCNNIGRKYIYNIFNKGKKNSRNIRFSTKWKKPNAFTKVINNR